MKNYSCMGNAMVNLTALSLTRCHHGPPRQDGQFEVLRQDVTHAEEDAAGVEVEVEVQVVLLTVLVHRGVVAVHPDVIASTVFVVECRTFGVWAKATAFFGRARVQCEPQITHVLTLML